MKCLARHATEGGSAKSYPPSFWGAALALMVFHNGARAGGSAVTPKPELAYDVQAPQQVDGAITG